MHRIDTTNSVPDANGPGKRGYRDGNKALGVLPTEFDAAWCNSMQEEVCAIIEAAGMALDKGQQDQLLAAITHMIDEVDTTGLPVGTIISISGDYDPVEHADYLVVPTAPTTLSRASYPELFAYWGIRHGAGDGVTTFGMYYLPANYALVQAAGGNHGSLTVGEVIAHSHTGVVSSIVNTGSNYLGAGTPFALYYNPSSSTGGPANLAAGSRVIFLVKYR